MKITKNEFQNLTSKYASEWLKYQLEELGYKRGKEFWRRFKHLYSNGSDNIGPVRNSQRQLICEEHGIASEIERTFFEMGSELFDEDPNRHCENFTSPDELHCKLSMQILQIVLQTQNRARISLMQFV